MMAEEVRGERIVVRFDGHKCIHSRHCVLDLPSVFVPNQPGEWIYPDRVPSEDVAALARSCPSGAITYERLDDGANERPPEVNIVRLRENGPLAFHGELTIGEDTVGFRATLCRCGASQHKPYCDGSHNGIAFAATGEPPAKESEPLARRNGPLSVVPTPDGPLKVEGSLEICAGTGRALNRTTKVFLCRCGGSANKPYCDGTHKRIGFTDAPAA